MKHKITYNLSGRVRSVESSDSKWKTLINIRRDEDIVCSALKNAAGVVPDVKLTKSHEH